MQMQIALCMFSMQRASLRLATDRAADIYSEGGWDRAASGHDNQD